jgi:hypothetical protein
MRSNAQLPRFARGSPQTSRATVLLGRATARRDHAGDQCGGDRGGVGVEPDRAEHRRVADAAGQTAISMTDARDSARELAGMSDELARLVSGFKI